MNLLEHATDAECADLARALPDSALAAIVRALAGARSALVAPHVATINALARRGLLDVVTAIAARRNVTIECLCGRDRSFATSAARHEAWAYLRDSGLSYPDIGRLFQRDHSTVINGVRAAARLRKAVPSSTRPEAKAS